MVDRETLPGDSRTAGGVPPYRPLFNRSLDRIWDFVEVRAGTSRWELRPQPDFTFNPSYWTGAFVANAFLVQVVTGLLLLFYYIPSVSLNSLGQPEAWASTYYIVHVVPMGWLLLTSHLYGAYAVFFLGFVHYFRGFYTGVYKRPRELSWMVGTILLVAMLGMGFTGYLLPFTALSVGATDVGISLTLSIPTLGQLTAPLLLADGTYQGLLSRMFAAHVVLIPLALAALLYAHVSLFEIHGIAPRATSDPRAKRNFSKEHDDPKLGKWFPKVFFYMTKWGILYAGLLFLIAAAFPWTLPPYFGSTSAAAATPEPDWYFLWLYKLIDFQYVSPLVAVGTVTVVLLFTLFLPWIDRPPLFTWKTHPRDRPVFLFLANFLAAFFILMTVWGGIMPGVLIPATMYGLYLGMIALVNVLLISLLYWLYRVDYSQRLAARRLRKGQGTSPGGSPVRPASSVRRAPAPASPPMPSAAPPAQEAPLHG